jgi:hypothetical protein
LSPPPLASPAVLLGGENRSGTTLLSVILNAHPELVVGPELDFTEPVDLGPHVLLACELLSMRDPRVLGPGTDTADPFWYDSAHFVKQCERFGIGLDRLTAIVSAVQGELGTDLADFDDRCVLIDRLGNLRRTELGAARWGIKLQRRIRRIEAYALQWPAAQFVHIVRDGRDLAASHLRTVPSWGYKSIREAAEGWLEVVSRPHKVAPAGRYLEIRYEDLVCDLPRVTKELADFLGIAWQSAMLRHSEYEHSLFSRPWGHPAAKAAAQPVSAGRVGRYRQDLSADQIAEFESIAGAELERLGYLGGSSLSI